MLSQVWRVRTGACLKKLSSAHSAGVSCLAFSRDSSQLVTGSFDCTLRIHGLRSGRTLRELRGHTAFVNTVLYSTDCSRVYSGSSDGTVRVWDARTADVRQGTCFQTLPLNDWRLCHLLVLVELAAVATRGE